MRIAMWSGPRNLSTAMMYAFGNRADCAVADEPFYAAYLAATGIIHPMRTEILASQPQDPETVAAYCVGEIPDGKPLFYMKHMAHHMVEGFPLDWTAQCLNVHLIRHPARVIASYGAKRDDITDDDIGFRQQAALFGRIGGIVIDSADIRENPDKMLRALCTALGITFDPAMLSWTVGRRAEDGVWASHWYNAVHQSTGFAAAEGELPMLAGRDAALLKNALPHYQRLHALRLK